MRLSLIGLYFVCALAFEARAENQILNRWTVEQYKADTSLQRHMTADLSGISIDGNYFYVSNPSGSLDKRFLSTGELDWKYELAGIPQTSWTLSGDEIFGGDTKGTIYALKNDGSLKWKNQTKGVFFSKPLVGDKQIWVMNSHGTLQSYDRQTGQWLWQQADPQSAQLSLWSFQGPVLFHNAIVSGFPSALLQAYEPSSGAMLWKESFSASVVENGESFNDLKSVGGSGEILVASSYSGDLKAWRAQAGGKKLLWQKKQSLYAPVTVSGGLLYFSGRDGSVQALDVETGFVKWKKELPRGLGTQPAVSGDRIWVGSSTGELYVFSEGGDLVARTPSFDSSIWNPVALLSPSEGIFVSSRAILRRVKLL
jgi:outer membrane protein assembly factor BamB